MSTKGKSKKGTLSFTDEYDNVGRTNTLSPKGDPLVEETPKGSPDPEVTSPKMGSGSGEGPNDDTN